MDVFSLIFSNSRYAFPIKGIYLNQMDSVVNNLFLNDTSISSLHFEVLKEGELKEISFAECKLETDEKVRYLAVFINYFDTLSKLNLSKNRFEQKHHDYVKSIWNHRGLVMPHTSS